MDKDTELKSLEKLAAVFGTTAEELYEKTNKSDELSECIEKDLAEVLSVLSQREHDVLVLRYGLNDGNQKTLAEVGNLFGVTANEIRQIEVKALRKLRKSSETNN